MKKMIIALACGAFLFTGCMKSTVTTTLPSIEEETSMMAIPTPDMEIHDDIILDWEQGVNDIGNVLQNLDYYPKMKDVSVMVDDEKKEITIVMSVEDDITPEEALEYAERGLGDSNNAVGDQDFSIAKAEDDVTYGGLYERYGVYVGIAPESTKDDESTWLVNEHLEKGEPFRKLQLAK